MTLKEYLKMDANVKHIIKRIIPRKILDIRTDWLEKKMRKEALYWKDKIINNPQKHAEYEMRRQNQMLIRPVNIKEPIYFNEKMLWLKYFLYNKSALVAKCYNKYEVREYVASKGLDYILNDLYGVWNSVDDIEWERLPDEYVIKVTNGWAGHVFKKRNKALDIKKAIKQIKKTLNRMEYQYYRSGDLFVGDTSQRIICERLLHSNHGYKTPEDYKFYCFHGEPLYLETMIDRKVENGSSGGYKVMFMDIGLHDRHELEKGTSTWEFDCPNCYVEMLDIARKLSADFPFVRVDLYVDEDRPIFGELTFTPSHEQTRESLIELGKLINLDDIRRYDFLLKNEKD